MSRFQSACERFGLGDHGVDANDVMKLWRSGSFTAETDLLESVEHFAFYLGTDHAKSIRHPKAVFLATLKAGYYAPPAGFRSWEERQAEAKLKAAKERLERLKELEREQFVIEFELWLRDLSDARWRELLHGTPWVDRRSTSDAVKSVLKPIFAAEREKGPQDRSK